MGAVKCEKVPTKKCYDTPRKVKEEICKPQHSRFCEKFTNEFPVPEQKQNCHTEPMKRCELEVRSRPKKAKKNVYHKDCKPETMKRCELEVRSRPKKAKKYVYHKDCKPVTRKVCDTCEKKTLSPVCDKIHKQVCK